MNADWRSFPNADEAAKACAQQIAALLQEAIPSSRAATLAVSGGSTPKLLFTYLARLPIEWPKVHLFWVDERAVPPDHPQSNYKLANENLVLPARIPQRNVHRICGELPPDKAAARYTTEIREFFQAEAGELPHFDVIHLGTGTDAHTASLFPGDPLLENRQDIAAATMAPVEPSQRVSLLPGVLLAARRTVFLVAGEDKARPVHDILRGPHDVKRYPAQFIARDGRKVSWFLDTAAARLLG